MSAALGLDRGAWPQRRAFPARLPLRYWERVARLEPLARVLVILLILWAALSDCVLLLRWDRATKPLASFVGVASTIAPSLGAFVSGDDHVAAFDSGALGYFSPVPVVNLDGLVNQDIRKVQRECSGEPYGSCLLRYLNEKRITVLVGCTAFGWTQIFPDWSAWSRLYESSLLLDGSEIVVLQVPSSRPR